MPIQTFFRQRSLTLFALYFAASGCIAACVAYPLWLLMPDVAFDKVLSRAAILAAALLLVPLGRWLALSRSEIGLPAFDGRQFAGYWLLGYLLILPPSVVFVLIDFRVFDVRVLDDIVEALRVAVMALVSGVLVGLFEEVLFRGVLLALWRRTSARWAVAGSSAVYALVHFVESAEPAVEPDWLSGFGQLSGAFAPLLAPQI